MWHQTFEQRLVAWNQLRSQCTSVDCEHMMALVNNWWFEAPWRPYHLHWDDRNQWPDPWQLLDDNIFCSLARGLGMLYTLAMIDHPEIHDAELVDTGTDNLVLVNQKKYILNWQRGKVLNINLPSFNRIHGVGREHVQTLIK